MLRGGGVVGGGGGGVVFFFNDTATTEIYTLSLHDALPISIGSSLPLTNTITMKIKKFIGWFSLSDPFWSSRIKTKSSQLAYGKLASLGQV